MLEVLHAFGLEPGEVTPVGAGQVNQHWTVTAGEQRFVLRRYRPERSLEAIRWEHELLRWAEGRGWPVATPLVALSGATVATIDGRHYSLFPHLPGAARSAESPATRRINGRLLARLHDDLARFPVEGQRPGFGRAWELDLFVEPAGAGTFNQLLARFGREHRELASAVRAQRYRNLRELARLGYGELSAIPVHGDFQSPNLFFEDGRLTGLLDFDEAHRDAAVYDVAAALMDCLVAPDEDAIDLRAAEAFIGGYTDHRRLDEAEVAMIPALFRASLLWFVAFRLCQWVTEGSERAVASIGRSVRYRFPAVDHAAPGLLAVARTSR